MRESAYELDGIGFNLVTSQDIDNDEISVIGDDLGAIAGDRKFARVAIIQIDDVDDEQKAYDLIRKIEYVKYHYFPKGYMIRTSSQGHKEVVRVSKSAVASGISFEQIGNLLINKFKENKAVKAVKIVFITDKSVDYKQLEKLARKNHDITETLNHIMNSVNFDCTTCNLKPICDEVEGMKELHFKTAMK
jgi:CO dehydrogenase/acetyl-CoA synthase beta subunit